MKKTLFAVAGVAMLTMAACSSTECKKGACSNDVDKVYTGVMPAADCDGVRYTLILDYDDDGREGDYQLVETYIEADTTSAIGYRDLKTFASEGDFVVRQKDNKQFLKLVKDRKDSSASADDVTYFLVNSDNTVTLTNADLEVSQTPGMNYTLRLAD